MENIEISDSKEALDVIFEPYRKRREKRNKQVSLFLKLKTNTKNIDTNRAIFVEYVETKGLKEYLIIDYKTDIAISNLTEITGIRFDILLKNK